MIIKDDFKNIAGRLKEAGVSGVNGMLLDLGVSSMQLDEAGRGFSFKGDGPLDMRMDPEAALTAKQIVNTTPKNELRDLLGTLGQERYAGRIAERIFQARCKRRIETTGELASIIAGAVPRNYRYGRIHPATRSFQALRITVNREIETLEIFLSQAAGCLAAGGRLVIISFHSLEDRLVKNAFKKWQAEGLGRILTKKPVVASEEETLANPRARSAKMRVFENV